MPIFEWKGYNSKGGGASGVIDADTPREARLKLKRENVLVTKLFETKKGKRVKQEPKKKGRLPGKKGVPARRRKETKSSKLKAGLAEKLSKARGREGGHRSKARLEEVSTFTRQLSTLLKAGIPLTEAMRAIIEQTQVKRLNMVYRDLHDYNVDGRSVELLELVLGHTAERNRLGLDPDIAIEPAVGSVETGKDDDVFTKLVQQQPHCNGQPQRQGQAQHNRDRAAAIPRERTNSQIECISPTHCVRRGPPDSSELLPGRPQ